MAAGLGRYPVRRVGNEVFGAVTLLSFAVPGTLDKGQRFGQFLPFSVACYFQDTAFSLPEHEGRVVLPGERGHEILASIVVDNREGEFARLADAAAGEKPFARVLIVAEVAGERAEDFLVGYKDVFGVCVEAYIYIVFLVCKMAFEGGRVIVGTGGLCNR